MNEWMLNHSDSSYWLATADLFEQAIKTGLPADGSIPLFHGDSYQDVMPLSPWLVPSKALVVINEQLIQQGILLESDYSAIDVLDHLRSLLLAGLDGEEVLFRFYDPRVIAPMLNLMQESEKYSFMGNIRTLLYWDSETVITLINPLNHDYKKHDEPWWVIKPNHLTNLYQMDTHCRVLERRFWSVIPEVMEKHFSSNQIIKDALSYSSENHWSLEKAELYALSLLLTSVNASIEDIASKFRLSINETSTLTKFSKVEA